MDKDVSVEPTDYLLVRGERMNEDISNRGFSLVELVIVVAIMSILIALLAPQYLKYVENSRRASDEELVKSIHDVIAVAITDENIKNKPLNGMSAMLIQNLNSTSYPDFVAQIQTDLGHSDLASLCTRLQSRNYRGSSIMVEITPSQHVIVTVPSMHPSVSALVMR